MKPALALAVAAAALATAFLGPPVLLEAWLLAFLGLASIAAGALAALAIGHLLSEDWLAPVRAPLEAAALTLPLVALLAIPVLVGLETLYPWAAADPPAMPAPRAAWFAPLPFRLRTALFLALWAALAWFLAQPGAEDRRRSALVLALLLPSVTLAAQDWSLSRDPTWWGSLQGFAVLVEGTMAALAAAALVSLARREMPPGETGAGEALERALLALGLATVWLWFTQFIVAWMADLPREAAWYLRRAADHWGVVKLGVAVPALLAALVLAAPPRHRRWRMASVCVLLLVSHAAHLWWVVRPDTPHAPPPAWLDAALALPLGAAWLAWWRAAIRRRVLILAARPGLPAPPPATASAH